MPGAKRSLVQNMAKRGSGSNIFSLNHSLDSKKEFYRTSYNQDFNNNVKKASWSAGTSNYDVIPPIGESPRFSKNGFSSRGKGFSKSESSLADMSPTDTFRSLPESCE